MEKGNRLLIHIVLICLSIPAILPLIWMISTSFKAETQIYTNTGMQSFQISSLWPSPLHPQNYSEALQTVPFGIYLRNTLILCLLTVLGAVGSSAVVAYGLPGSSSKARRCGLP